MELSRARPLIDLHMLTSRQFGTCFLVMLGTRALLIATTQALPLLLQDQYGYTATWAGLAISSGRRSHNGDDAHRRPSRGCPTALSDRKFFRHKRRQMVQSQAAVLAYIDVFFALAVVAGIMSLSLRSVTRGARA